jgi:UDP-glucuronate decarboxylase
MKYLVTGGAGFLGRNLIKSLLEDGHGVIALDNLVTGSLKNLDGLTQNTNFQFVQGDVRLFDPIKVDGIFNLACPASPPKYQSDPIDTFMTNILGAKAVLDLATSLDVPVLQASTSEIYGDPEVSPQNESYWGNVNPIGIRSCYDEGKRAAETLFFDFLREKNTNIRVARIFNTYGPYMAADDGRVVSNFIVQSLAGKPITIYGSGNQTRSFCYVDDLVVGLKSLMFSSNLQEPVNLGNPESFTMIELAKLVLEITGSKSQLQFKPLPMDDPKNRKPDISLARKSLNFSPSVEIREGLERTIEYFKRVLINPNSISDTFL